MRSDQTPKSASVPIGKVIRSIGLKGEIAVSLLSGDPSRISAGTALSIKGHTFSVRQVRQGPRGSIVVRLEGIRDVEAADTLRGNIVEMNVRHLPSLPPGHFYHYELIGLRVINSEERFIGTIKEIIETGSNDVYAAYNESSGTETLIPAVPEAIHEVQTQGGFLKVDEALCIVKPAKSAKE